MLKVPGTGKGKFNQLITFLDKTGNVKDSLGGRADNSALRAVRSKREAEEAGMSPYLWYIDMKLQRCDRQGISQRCPLAGDASIAENQDSPSRIRRE